MRVSVIVTTYNWPQALERVLAGLMRQTRPPDEVVVADDGSGGETRRVIEAATRRAGFAIGHVWQEDRGFRVARARNQAIESAQGEYLVLLDGDCVPGPRFIEDHARLAQHGRFFQGRRVLLSQKAAKAFEPERFSIVKLFFSPGLAHRHHLMRLPLPGRSTRKIAGIMTCNMGLFRADAMAVNGFNEDFTGWGREDSEFAARLYKYGLLRKEHAFRAVCFHLWHGPSDRGRLGVNDELLKKTLANGSFWCANGIKKAGERSGV